MSVRITWSPSPNSDIAGYEIYVSTSSTGAASLLATVPHNLTGPNYDSVVGVFFYVDPSEELSRWYYLVAYNQEAVRSAPTARFQVASAPGTGASLYSRVKVDAAYGSEGALCYRTPSGEPVVGAVVRVWRKIDFDTGNTSQPLALTTTNVDGEWANPVFVEAGHTYTIQFHKEGAYGPDSVEVTI